MLSIRSYFNQIFGILITLLLFQGCQDSSKDTLFNLVASDHSGITFNNQIFQHINDSINPLTFEYTLNGAGVAAADFNNDGLLDLFFGGNVVTSELYLNQGVFKFKNVTEASGTRTNQWVTGITAVDINTDGWTDIYACVSGIQEGPLRKNLLFINQGVDANGIPKFVESASSYGLDDASYSTMAAFLDYDKDGDLDMYLLNNSLEVNNRNVVRPKLTDGSARNQDRLYRNNGNNTFSDISAEAGILLEGWGLGVCVADINQDNWPDIYVANDFLSNDILWINQGDGTFENKIGEYMKHQTHNGMGVDVADYNNDLLPDIVVLDMLPEDNYREKMMLFHGNNYENFMLQQQMGYETQYMRNTLQLNQGKMPDGSLRFSEIGYLANIYRTDWSWAPLLADFDLDGYKDLFVANGYRLDVTNLDFIVYQSANNMFGTPEARIKESFDEMMQLPEVKLHNYMYRNTGDLRFEDVSEKWGFEQQTFSNGAIVADLDNDGDLDIAINNMDDEAGLYENTVINQETDESSQHYIRLKLTDNNNSNIAYGAKVYLKTGDSRQYAEYNPVRGYKSTVEPFVHFGLGEAQEVDTILVVWPDGSISVSYGVAANQLLTIDHQGAKSAAGYDAAVLNMEVGPIKPNHYLVSDITSQFDLDEIVHNEKNYNDFNNTPMLPRLLSKEGPYVATGDLNADGMEDFVLSGDRDNPTTMFFQQPTGEFKQQKLSNDSIYEDRSIVIADFNNDNFPDVFVASGGSQFPEGSNLYQDRLYLNDGTGNFVRDLNAVPVITSSTSAAAVSDFDGDGDPDLFIGGRLIPRKYPYAPQSFLLRNDKGRMVDVTADIAPELGNVGMVTDVAFADLDNNGSQELILVGEWMPVTIFEMNKNGVFVNVTTDYGLSEKLGWFYSIAVADLDADGLPDIIAGNNGLNSYYRASADEPLEIVAKDFDQTGSIDPILTHYHGGERVISYYRDRLISQINGMKGRFQRYDNFASATFDQSFSDEELTEALHLSCTELASAVLRNTGNRSFAWQELPVQAQFAPVTGIHVEDLNRDGNKDIILVGNNYAEEVGRGWYDASLGTILLGNGDFQFETQPARKSGLVAEGDVKQIVPIQLHGNRALIITRNDGHLLAYQIGMGE